MKTKERYLLSSFSPQSKIYSEVEQHLLHRTLKRDGERREIWWKTCPCTIKKHKKRPRRHQVVIYQNTFCLHKNRLTAFFEFASFFAFPQKKNKKRGLKNNTMSSSSCAQHQQLSSSSFRGRVGKTSSSASSSCSTSFSSRGGGRKATLKCFASGAISKPWDVQKPCKLVLEDGSVWQGKAFGADGTKVGEVVFNTSLSGYVSFSLL